MPQISHIKLNDIQEAQRFDAEYFKLEYLNNEKVILSNDWQFCEELVSKNITKGETPLWQGFLYQKFGIPFIRSQDLSKFGIKDDNIVYVSEEYNKLKNKSVISYGDSLLAIVGATIGKVGFYNLSKKGNCNQAVAIISPVNNILKYYFNILLQTKNIQLQIKRTQGGNARDNFDLFEVKKLKIPLLKQDFQLKIEELIKLAHEKQTKSKQLYKEAEELFLKELGLLDYKPKHTLTFNAFKKEIDQTERIDAEYYQPKYEEMMDKVKKVSRKLGELVVYSKGVEVGSEVYLDEGKPFLRVADFSNQGIEQIEKKISEELFEKLKNSYSPKKDEVLFTKDGTIGLSYALDKDLDVIISGAFLRLTIQDKNIDKEYLTLVLNSLVCKMQIEQVSGGALISHLKPSDAMKLLIPIISTNKRKQIAEKITLSKELRQESKELLNEAKIKVEEEIERRAK